METTKIRLVNLTPHNVTLILKGGEQHSIPPSGIVARVTTKQETVELIELETDRIIATVPVVKSEFAEVHGLPLACENCKRYDECELYFKEKQICGFQEPEEYYIVSSLVAMAMHGRRDIVAPDTSPNGVVRDEYGNIIGVKRFQKW